MIAVKINGLNQLAKFTQQYPEISEKYVNLAISRSLLRILGKVKTEAPFGMAGLLRDNWQLTTGRFEGRMTSLASYAQYVEFGTGPHMPPVDVLTPWANKRGINPWALAMSIKKKGTKANPFLQRSLDASVADIEGEFETALNSAMSEVNNISDTL